MASRRGRDALAAGVAGLTLVAAACSTGQPQSARPASVPPEATGSTPTPATSGPVATTASPPPCSTARVLATWRLPRLAEQTVVVPADEGDLAAVAPEVAAGAGGVLLFGSRAPWNLRSSLSRLTRRAPGRVRPLVMTDEEGGAVQRMANLVGWVPSAREMASTMTPARIRRLAARVGRRMKTAGVTMDLAPVLDLDGRAGPSAANPDGTRSFSPKASTAAAAGLAFAAGLESAGVVPVVKHFPGLGGATGNTDVVPASTRPWSRLRADDLRPFRAAIRAGVPAVMVSNAAVPGLTRRPAGLSPTLVTGVLRRRLGFTGLVLTDSLSAGAVAAAGYDVPRASVRAIAAGADMVLFKPDESEVASVTRATVEAVVGAVRSGELSRRRLQDAVGHVLAAKHVDLCR